MSETPRQRTGGFPQTPGTASATGRKAPQDLPTPPSTTSSRSTSLPLAPQNAPRRNPSEPVIPLTLLDGPQQRFYAAATYALLWAYKLYDYSAVVRDDEISVWLFLKWVLIDFAFLFGLPELRIPWLELSQSTVLALWAVQSFVNWLLMFNVGVCPCWPSSPMPLSLLVQRELTRTADSFLCSHGSWASQRFFTTGRSLFPSRASKFLRFSITTHSSWASKLSIFYLKGM